MSFAPNATLGSGRARSVRTQRARVVQSLVLGPGVPIARPVIELELPRAIFR